MFLRCEQCELCSPRRDTGSGRRQPAEFPEFWGSSKQVSCLCSTDVLSPGPSLIGRALWIWAHCRGPSPDPSPPFLLCPLPSCPGTPRSGLPKLQDSFRCYILHFVDKEKLGSRQIELDNVLDLVKFLKIPKGEKGFLILSDPAFMWNPRNWFNYGPFFHAACLHKCCFICLKFPGKSLPPGKLLLTLQNLA